MRRAHYVRGALGVILTGLVGSTGCTHNYYYGGVPTACAPGTTTIVPGSIQYGSVCEVPSRLFGGGTVVASSPGVRSSVVGTAPSGSRVVVSEPANGSGPSWRRSDPESNLAARTRVEGALEDDTTVK
jgi:hypothetical protein